MQGNPPRHRTKARHIRVPPFLPVPLRARCDGWTALRQAQFLVALARTRSVAAAAREVGLSRVSAYQLRNRTGAESFAASWDAVQAGTMVPLRKFTPEERRIAAIEGLVKPIVWRGRCVAIAQKCDDSALLGLFRRLSAQAGKEDFMALEAGAFHP
ncbi:LysR family transcriptional regulator [Novosphingobium sp.]|uniref:helix-turn-helix domain-containing protein n=1 Tax=Novosphingobium sp. TaxID=1874826 RepID=UPI0025DCE102|nr:LysR family transcriptional regulator [Novosphingobium sp.]MCC6925336.1 LysR family transcriptional regulator [Novosphingobium sp.]